MPTENILMRAYDARLRTRRMAICRQRRFPAQGPTCKKWRTKIALAHQIKALGRVKGRESCRISRRSMNIGRAIPPALEIGRAFTASVKLPCKRHRIVFFSNDHPTFANHVNEFDASESIGAERKGSKLSIGLVEPVRNFLCRECRAAAHLGLCGFGHLQIADASQNTGTLGGLRNMFFIFFHVGKTSYGG
ncbi:hypothetical protein ACO0LO_02085 [Undibacterium sp. TJN25]|uniref:hypothetical protein n=1 Tax=Undibacterium sp. TJN25 TaxID=3413056 RepID=UPI003BF11000